MTLPMVTCPLCCRPGFSTSDSLCSALIDVTTRKLCCPICNCVVVGLDKFTIHLFSHSVNKCIESSKATYQICDSGNTYSSKSSTLNNAVLEIEASINSVQLSPGLLKLPCSVISNDVEDNKSVSIPESSIFCFNGENGQIFTISSECAGSSFKNVTINTQNYITNTNITTSTVQTNVIEKIRKRKYCQTGESECSETKTKNETNSLDNYSNIESVNSWPSTSSNCSEADKPSSIIPEKEFESCKELLTKGDFSTLGDDVSDLDPKTGNSPTDSVVSDGLNDDPDERSDGKKNGFSCSLCHIVLPNKTILAMHKQLIHKKLETEVENKPKLLDCSMCPRTFSLRSSLMIHRKVAHAGGFGNNDSGNFSKDVQCKYTCSICEKVFKKEIHLNQHMKAHDEKQWLCTICFKTFTTKYFLKKHRRLHTGETPYKCVKCDKAFTFQQSYHKHLLYHNDEKPYCCAQCGRLFKELSTLHNHERIHSGEKPFTCETCGKAFRQRVSYLVHRRIHTGAMPYKCTACDKSFRYKISERTHKCPAQPPGVVVRTNGSLVERLQAAMSKSKTDEGVIPKAPASEPMEHKLNCSGTEPSSVTEIQSSTQENQQVSTSKMAYSPCSPEVDTDKSVTKLPFLQHPEPGKLQVEKPQIYILFKGPNDETYYQPLIISQSPVVASPQNSSPCQVDPSVLGQPCATSYSVIETLPSSSSSRCHKSIESTKHSLLGGNIVIPQNNQENSNYESFQNSIYPKAKEIGSDQYTLHGYKKNPKEVNLLSKASGKEKQINSVNNNTSLTNAQSEASTMEDILNELNCEVLQESPSSGSNTHETDTLNNSCEVTEQTNSDMIAMDSNDIFSFMLSPNLSSPSDRLGKLTLSPASSGEQNPSSPKTSNSDPYTDSISNVAENLLDNMTDDALRELLFGKLN